MMLVKSILKYVLILGLLAVVLFPLFWMALASFQHQVDIMNSRSGLFNFTPTSINYETVFAVHNFTTPISNSFLIALGSTIAALILGLPASYSIARFKLNKLGLVILVVRMVPGITFLVPWFIIFSRLGLVDTYTGIVLSHMLVALPFIVWVMVPFFESIPREMEESAMVDGSTQFFAFFRILTPLARPGIFTASLLSFIFSWNNFMFSLVLTGRNWTTLPVAIFSFIAYARVDWGGLMAAASVITLPILVISVILQKYVVSGLTAGAVKG
jgi:multiple sugar transport system permease protein